MAKVTKTAIRKQWREINSRIWRNILLFIIGPKFDNKYVIDCSHKTSHSDIIRVLSEYGKPQVTLYFDYRIRMSVSWVEMVCEPATSRFYDLQAETCELPTSDTVDEYIKRVTDFLREYILHIIRFRNDVDPRQYKVANIDECPDCIKGDVLLYNAIVLHEYSVEEMDSLLYLTKLMKSKAFRRYRGDYK